MGMPALLVVFLGLNLNPCGFNRLCEIADGDRLAFGGVSRRHMTSRRNFIYGVIAAQLASRFRGGAFAANTGNNPTWLENQNAGTPNWQVGLPGYLRSDDFTLHINGYASATSIN